MKMLGRFGMKAQPITDLCCASPLIRAGLNDDAKSIAQQLNSELRENRIKNLICSCPGCTLTLRNMYPNLVSGWKPRVLHISEILAKRKDDIAQAKGKKRIIYHDPCHLARGLGIISEPRQILSILGHETIEFERSGKRSVCCGSGGCMALLYPKEAKRTTKIKIKKALELKADVLATFCPLCQRTLSQASEGDMLVKDVAELLFE
jgi:fumarate reductase (CoM/CoB) subunit B